MKYQQKGGGGGSSRAHVDEAAPPISSRKNSRRKQNSKKAHADGLQGRQKEQKAEKKSGGGDGVPAAADIAFATFKALFPHLSEHVRSVLLVAMLDELLPDAPIDAMNGCCTLERQDIVLALDWFSSPCTPDSLYSKGVPACQQKLQHLKESFFNGTQLPSFRGFRARNRGGAAPLYHRLSPKTVEAVTAAATEIATAPASALIALPRSIGVLKGAAPPGGWFQLEPLKSPKTVMMVTASVGAGGALPPPQLQRFTSSAAARALAAKALQNLSVASKLLGSGSGGLSDLSLSADIDFGVQSVVVQQSNMNSSLLKDPQGLLDAIVLSGKTSTSSTGSSNAEEDGAAAAAESALHFGHFVFENVGSDLENTIRSKQDLEHQHDEDSQHTVWLLGGMAAPELSSTFITTDSARLFWAEGGGRGVCVGTGQRHTITVALCRLDGPSRSAEKGILQQAVLLFVAVRRDGGDAFHELPRVQGAAYVDVYENASACNTNNNDNNGGGAHLKLNANPPVAVLGSPELLPNHPNVLPLYRVFAVARRITVALLDPSQLQATVSTLTVDAKPFIPPRLKTLFNHPPQQLHAGFPQHVVLLLNADASTQFSSAAANRHVAKQSLLHSATGNLFDDGKKNSCGASESVLCVLRRYHRLLQLEERAMEEDIARHDHFHSRLKLAVFNQSNPRKYAELKLMLHSSAAEQHDDPPKTGFYRGPAVHKLFSSSASSFEHERYQSEYVLGMLRVPGLPEGRPAVVIGDYVHLRPCAHDNIEFICIVASTDGTTVFLVLPPSFYECLGVNISSLSSLSSVHHHHRHQDIIASSTYCDGLFHVRFSFDRRPLQHMRTALCTAAELPHTTLVPPVEQESVSLPEGEQHRELRRRSLPNYSLQPLAIDVERFAQDLRSEPGFEKLNTEQSRAVAAVVLGAGRASPYGLHGPPGTGKTVTLVAAALKLCAVYPHARLLCCAPQNYSADLLCSALAAAGMGTDHLLRLNDPRRPPYSSKEDVLPYCVLDKHLGMFQVPDVEDIAQYQVVVTTCAAAALLFTNQNQQQNSYTSNGGFSHVLIDEGGQALLPEALIPLSLLRPPPPPSTGWGAVLCGDPQQLGPTVRSPVAAGAGLAASLLERLIHAHSCGSVAVQLQDRDGRAPATSMLMANYRSHASLLDLPSKLFYQGQLMAAADPSSVLPPKWKELYTAEEEEQEYDDDNDDDLYASAPAASLMFYGVRGQQAREGDVPSYHNPLEAAAVADLVEGLVLRSGAGVTANDVGVMATYRRQVQSIRIMLRQRGLGEVRVGTVDDYQGQEERIMLISTVLSKPDCLPGASGSKSSGGGDAHLGLWNNPKRFNVAITRAKALLVVVGHPAVLIEDRSWRELIRHCAATGAFRGAGAAALAERLQRTGGGGGGGGNGSSSSQLPDVFDFDGLDVVSHNEGGGGDGGEMARAVDQMAALALLGSGDAARTFPETLEEMHDAYAEETQWRIML